MTPNDTVEIKPTEAGWHEIVRFVDETNDRLRQYQNLRHRMSVPKPDEDGYIRGQFWHLMQFFDWTRGIGDIHFYDMRLLPNSEIDGRGLPVDSPTQPKSPQETP